jgi:hypothetical protein
MKNQGLGIVEGLVPSKMVEEPTHMFIIRRAGDVEHQPLGIVAAPFKKKKTLDDGDTPGSNGTLEVSRLGRADLKEGAVVAVGE